MNRLLTLILILFVTTAYAETIRLNCKIEEVDVYYDSILYDLSPTSHSDFIQIDLQLNGIARIKHNKYDNLEGKYSDNEITGEIHHRKAGAKEIFSINRFTGEYEIKRGWIVGGDEFTATRIDYGQCEKIDKPKF